MSADAPLLGIRVRLSADCSVFSGFGQHHYAFTNQTDAKAFIRENWTTRSASWRRQNLSVQPLPPHITVRGGYLTLERKLA